MHVNKISGTEGYAETAAYLVKQWQEISFEEHHAMVLHLLPTAPSQVLDIGSGIGKDAAAFAAMGHSVVAVEPMQELRLPGIALHDAQGIIWLDDSLPDLSRLCAMNQTFDLIMLSAVWMHLDAAQRQRAMPRLAELMNASATLILSLRHGPVPAGRRMFDVSVEETIELAATQNLLPILNVQTASVQKLNQQSGVTWTRLAFRRSWS
ncbi:MAG: methyltransferase domain-containing protein [Burkholderiales bacterium]|nr:methyltransferase domain-containing protein [Burkholderiales bacterium]MBI3728865.1 methyltransferase domain-containing protein [Burkholderiales bacterium]